MNAIVTLLGGIRATVFASLLMLTLGLLWWQTSAKGRAETALDAHLAADTKAELRAQAVARATEQAWAKAHYDLAYGLETKRIAREHETDRTIAGLRDGTVRLRERFTCPRVPAASPAAGSGDDPARYGLRPADAEFLVRLADKADGVAEQLSTCQAVIAGWEK